jgi:hypothetical protein
MANLVVGSFEWFKKVVGLLAQGLIIRKEFNDEHASLEECEKKWGKKTLKDGFKHLHYKYSSFIARVQKLWPLVYQKDEVINNIVSLTFTNGVLVEKIVAMNWAKVAIEALKQGGGSHKSNTQQKKIGKNTMRVANSRFAKISMKIQKNQTSLVTIDFESQKLAKSFKKFRYIPF